MTYLSEEPGRVSNFNGENKDMIWKYMQNDVMAEFESIFSTLEREQKPNFGKDACTGA